MKKRKGKGQGKIAALFLLPYLLVFTIFRFGPSVAGLFVGFLKWNLAGSASFAGLANFVRLVKDQYFGISLLNTLKFFLLTLPPLLVFSLLMAMLLNQKIRFKSAGRVIAIIPYVLIPAIVGIMWNWMYDNSFGILNFYIKTFGGHAVNWLTDEKMALVSVSMVVIWSYIGYNMVLFLAGLQGISNELYEAASIDGANPVQTFFRITLPMLSPITAMITTLTLVNIVQLFDQIFVMTNGGPGTSTLTMVQYLYTSAFQNYDLGYGSAIEIAILILLVGLIKVQNMVMKVEEGV